MNTHILIAHKLQAAAALKNYVDSDTLNSPDEDYLNWVQFSEATGLSKAYFYKLTRRFNHTDAVGHYKQYKTIRKSFLILFFEGDEKLITEELKKLEADSAYMYPELKMEKEWETAVFQTRLALKNLLRLAPEHTKYRPLFSYSNSSPRHTELRITEEMIVNLADLLNKDENTLVTECQPKKKAVVKIPLEKLKK